MKKALEATIKAAFKSETAKERSCKKTILDTTVMKKNVTFPTDDKLCQRVIQILRRKAKKVGLLLRQNYERVSKKTLGKIDQYAHARQMNRMKREGRRLKTYLGRIQRDISRRISGN